MRKKTSKKDTKSEILNGAINLFSKKGYTETSMREISLEANIQPGSIYNHFKSKQEILDHILETYAAHVEENAYSQEAVDNLEKEASIENIMACFSLAYPEDGARQLRKMLYIILHEQHRIDSVRQYVVEKLIFQNERHIRAIIDMLEEKSLIEPVDSDAVAKLYVALIYFWANANHFGLDTSTEFTHKNSMRDVLRFLLNETIKIKPNPQANPAE